jgi:integrase
MERAKNKAIVDSSSRQEQQLTRKKSYYKIEDCVRSNASKVQYKWQFNKFLEYSHLSEEKIIEIGTANPRELEAIIIAYLNDYLFKKKKLKHSSINTAMAAFLSFCDVNDVVLNKRKIGKFIPPDENNDADRHYTHDEIEKLIQDSDRRFKVVILLLAGGMRVGAVPNLEIRDLTEPEIGDGEITTNQKIYKIMVYNRSKSGRYYTFATPECAEAIDDYLEFRKNRGEDITKKTSPLIREQFDVNDRLQAAQPKKIKLSSIIKIIERNIEKSGINTTGQVMKTNGFRKFAITQMIKSKVDYEVREYLVGHKHSRGLDVNYDRTLEWDRLTEWKKAIPNLTISSAFRNKVKLKKIEGEQAQKIAKQSQEIDILKAQLEASNLQHSNDYKELLRKSDEYQARMFEIMSNMDQFSDEWRKAFRKNADDINDELKNHTFEKNYKKWVEGGQKGRFYLWKSDREAAEAGEITGAYIEENQTEK